MATVLKTGAGWMIVSYVVGKRLGMQSIETVYQWLVNILGIVAGMLIGSILGVVLGDAFATKLYPFGGLDALVPPMYGFLLGAVAGASSWILIEPWVTRWDRPEATIRLLLIIILVGMIVVLQMKALLGLI